MWRCVFLIEVVVLQPGLQHQRYSLSLKRDINCDINAFCILSNWKGLEGHLTIDQTSNKASGSRPHRTRRGRNCSPTSIIRSKGDFSVSIRSWKISISLMEPALQSKPIASTCSAERSGKSKSTWKQVQAWRQPTWIINIIRDQTSMNS